VTESSITPWSRVRTLAVHEYRAAVRSRTLVVLTGILVVVTIASAFIASVEYRSKLADYEAYRAAAEAGGLDRIAPSPLALLSLLRGAMEYLEIIGAIIAIALGYLTVSRERANRTLPLLRSRPVTSRELTAGSLLGATGVIATLVAATAVTAVLCLGIIGKDWINGYQALKMLFAYVAAVIYLVGFYCLGALITARSRVAANGLVIALGIWLAVVLVLPQIGDTLDADNQVPGGLFKSLSLDKPKEDLILSHFGTYEEIRTDIEEASYAKHFERFAFAMTDVKDKYRGFSLGRLFGEKRNDLIWMFAYSFLLISGLFRSFRRQPTIPSGGNS
jgi:ABC-type transport system involved in multi-copper enzyme maturation permease subunit